MNIPFVQFIKFGIVGAINTAVYYIFYAGFVYIKAPYLLANIVAAVVSILNSYFWNRGLYKKMCNEAIKYINSNHCRKYRKGCI